MNRVVTSLLQVLKNSHCIIHIMKIRDLILVEANAKNYFDDYFAVIFSFVSLFLDFFLGYFILLKFWVLNAAKKMIKQVSYNKQSVFDLWIG